SMQLVPGMPAEVHFRTAERTAMSYLLKPLMDQVARAFKEH
ncbi:MAG: prsE 1, partial [Hyphomicrobiales bacterium]|nr:prsE 1 [Hyphomicrobiales bacterium]